MIINSKYIIIVAAGLFILFGCGKKKDSAFCFSCENGVFVADRGDQSTMPYSIFIKENGDTLAIINGLSDTFNKESSVAVCARLKKYKGAEKAIYIHPTYVIKCISKRDD